MAKDISITSDGTVTARGSGSPEEGGNLNNHIALSVHPGKKRVGISTGLGATLDANVGNGVKLIGSTGFAVQASGNVGITADQAERQHDSRYDVPLRPNAIGFKEGRQIVNSIAGLKGGDITKYTLGETEAIVNNHPNLLKPKSLESYRGTMGMLEGINTGKVLTPEVTGRIEEIAGQLRDRYGVTIPTEGLTSAGSISAADILRAQTLTRINGAATAVQGAVASHGGVEGINASIDNAVARGVGGANNAADRLQGATTAINNAVASLPPGLISQSTVDRINTSLTDAATSLQGAQVPQRAVEAVQDTVRSVSATADNLAEQYKKIPSVEKVQQVQRQVDTMVRHDPTLRVSGFAALGAKKDDAGAALVVQRAMQAGLGNLDWVAGEGARLHKATIDTKRIEVGTGQGALSFSPDTAQKLNLSVAGGSTAVGGYAFVEQERVRWGGIDGARTTKSAGLGASISKGLGGGNTGVVSVEAFDSRIDQTTPGNIPGKTHDKGVAVKGRITF